MQAVGRGVSSQDKYAADELEALRQGLQAWFQHSSCCSKVGRGHLQRCPGRNNVVTWTAYAAGGGMGGGGGKAGR